MCSFKGDMAGLGPLRRGMKRGEIRFVNFTVTNPRVTLDDLVRHET